MSDYINVTDGVVRTTSTSEDEVFYANAVDREAERSRKNKDIIDSMKKKSRFRFDKFDDDDKTNYFMLSHDSNNSPSILSRESTAASSISDIESCASPGYVNTPIQGYVNLPSPQKKCKDSDELHYTNIYHKSDKSENSSLRLSSINSLARCDVSYTNIDFSATNAVRRACRSSVEKEEEEKKRQKKSSKEKKAKRFIHWPVSLKLGH